jgi:putative ABC transport system substrate-binding protein
MKRREFIALLAGAAAVWPLAGRGQERERLRRIGVLQGLAANDPEGQNRFDAFFHALQQLGWTDGRNIQATNRLSPEILEPVRRQLGEAHRVLDVFVAEPAGRVRTSGHDDRDRAGCSSGREVGWKWRGNNHAPP